MSILNYALVVFIPVLTTVYAKIVYNIRKRNGVVADGQTLSNSLVKINFYAIKSSNYRIFDKLKTYVTISQSTPKRYF